MRNPAGKGCASAFGDHPSEDFPYEQLVGGCEMGRPAAALYLPGFLSCLLLGTHKPSRDQEAPNNLLSGCWVPGTGQAAVTAMSSRPSGEPAYIVGRMVELT